MSGNVEAKAQWAERVLGVRIPRAAPVIGTQRLAQQPAAPTAPAHAAVAAPYGGADPPKVPAQKPAAPDTPEAKAYKEAYGKIKHADDLIDDTRPGSEVAKLGMAFKAIPMPPDPNNVVDFVQALADAQPKLALAPPFDKAFAYDYTESEEMPSIRKAGVFTKQSGAMKGNEKANREIVALTTRAIVALKTQDYATAGALLRDAGTRARKVSEPYETLVRIEQNKPLFARVEKLLGQKKLSPDLQQEKGKYNQLSKNFAAALKATDHKARESAFDEKRKQAILILKTSQQQQVEDWYDTQQARPAEGSGSGIATGLATMPDLSAMSEADKSAAMCTQIGWQDNDLKTQATEVYAKALREGQKLDLTPAQIAAAAGYSGSYYSDMNGLLRGSLDTTERTPERLDLLKVHIELLRQALDNLPDYDPAGFPLFRWETPHGDHLRSRYQVDSPVFEIKEFWSTGAGGGTVVGGGGLPTAEILVWGKKKSKAKSISILTVIDGEGGRADKAQLKGQGTGEVLFAPGTRFKTRFFKAFDRNNKEVLNRIDVKDGQSVDFHYRIEVEEV
jgi:hypothetical protein